MKAEVGKRYQHYKNRKFYIVRGVGRHTETMEELVVYEAQYDDPEFGNNALWMRPKEMFEEKLEYEGKTVERFTLVEEESTK